METGVVLIQGDKITIQPARYIEDDWYIEVIQSEITLFEIPLFGGDPVRIGRYSTLIDAIEAANNLT